MTPLRSGKEKPAVIIASAELDSVPLDDKLELSEKEAILAQCLAQDTGGLGDQVTSQLRALQNQGDFAIYLAMPHYKELVENKASKLGQKEKERLHDTQILLGKQKIYFIEDPIFARGPVYGGDEARKAVVFASKLRDFTKWVRTQHPEVIVNSHEALGGFIPAAIADLPDVHTLHTAHNIYTKYTTLEQADSRLDIEGMNGNLYFEDSFPAKPFSEHDKRENRLNILATGLHAADEVNTVSEGFDEEMATGVHGWDGVTKAYAEKKKQGRARGIRNAVDEKFRPENLEHLLGPFSETTIVEAKKRNLHALYELIPELARTDTPLILWSNRLVEQKGTEYLDELLKHLDTLDVRVVFIADGKKEVIAGLKSWQRRRPGSIVYREFDSELEQVAIAASDLTYMPVKYAPCDLLQTKGQLLGTLPIGTRTGGLKDTIEDGVTGFLGEPLNVPSIIEATTRGVQYARQPLERREAMMQNAMAVAASYTPEMMVAQYIKVFEKLLTKKD